MLTVRAAVGGCWLAAVLLPLVLTGCSGTRLGETLSRSFSGAPTVPSAGSATSGTGKAPAGGGSSTPTLSSGTSTAPPGPASPGTAPGAPTGTASAAGQASPAGKTRAPGAPQATAAAAAARAPATPLPARPAPYRVTILLPQADASAPAEVVTQALRAAGVPFEVETIERIGSGSSLAAPAAGAGSTQVAPTVRSAPAPR